MLRMKGFSKTTQNLILSLLFFTLGLSVAVFTFYYVDKEGRKLELQMEIVSKNQQLQERFNSLEVQVNNSKAEHDELESYLLTENDTIGFLSEIETIASSMGLKLTTDALKVDPLNNPKFQTITLQLRVSGEHSQVLYFLQILETLPYFSRIEALKFDKEYQSGQSWVAAVTLLIGLHTHDQ